MDCPEFPRTSAFIDGELDTVANLEAERHVAGCVHCQAFVAAAANASEALRSPAARFSAPAGLRDAIRRDLDREERVGARRDPRRPFLAGLLSGAGVSGLAAALAILAILPPSAQSLADALTDAHVHALMSGKTIEVVSSNHHTVKPWFAGRAPLSPPVSDLAAQGFALVGGRVDKVLGAKTAVLSYRHGAHEIDLFVWPASGRTPPPAGDRVGYHLVSWRSGDLAFTAVSDVQPSELTRFVELVQAERE